MHSDQRPEAQKRRSAGTLFVEPIDLLLSCFQLLAGGAWIPVDRVKLEEIHVQLNAVEWSLGRFRGETGERGVVFLDCLVNLFPLTSNLSANCMQTVVVRVDLRGALEK